MQLIDTVKQGTGQVDDANKRSMFNFMDRDRSGTITRKVNGVTGFFFWHTLARCCCARSFFYGIRLIPPPCFFLQRLSYGHDVHCLDLKQSSLLSRLRNLCCTCAMHFVLTLRSGTDLKSSGCENGGAYTRDCGESLPTMVSQMVMSNLDAFNDAGASCAATTWWSTMVLGRL